MTKFLQGFHCVWNTGSKFNDKYSAIHISEFLCLQKTKKSYYSLESYKTHKRILKANCDYYKYEACLDFTWNTSFLMNCF